MTKRFVSWSAVSSLPQAKKISLDDQLSENRRHVERHGGTLVSELVVPGESRSIILFEDACRRIDAYAKLRQLIEDRAFDVLVYLDRSRLGRQASLVMTIEALCRDAGITLYETDNPPATLERAASYDDQIVGALKSIGAEQEINKLRHRHAMGMKERARRGLFPANPIYGYRREGEDGYAIVPEQADVIRLVVSLYLDSDLSFQNIADHLNARAYPAPAGGQWSAGGIGALIDRIQRYAGWSIYNVKSARETVHARGQWPAIIDQSTADAVEQQRAERDEHRRRANVYTYLYARAVYCAECGAMMRATASPNPTPESMYYGYRCNNTDSHATGKRHIISERKITAAVRAAIEALADGITLNQTIDQDNTRAELEASIESAAAELAALEVRRRRLIDAFARSLISDDDLTLGLSTLDEQARGIEQRIADAAAALTRLRHDAERPARIRSAAEVGLAMLEGDRATANRWVRRHLRIYCVGSAVETVMFV